MFVIKLNLKYKVQKRRNISRKTPYLNIIFSREVTHFDRGKAHKNKLEQTHLTKMTSDDKLKLYDNNAIMIKIMLLLVQNYAREYIICQQSKHDSMD